MNISVCDKCNGEEGAPWDCMKCAGVGVFDPDNTAEESFFLIDSMHKHAQHDPEEELRLWRRWKAGDLSALAPLLDRFQAIINKWYGKVSHYNLPESAIRAEIEIQVIKALDRYDPHRGVKLSTWIESNLPKVYRFAGQHQNIGRIPEHRIRKISSFESAKSTLNEKFGREPSAIELSDELGWKMRDVTTLQRELRRDLSQSRDFEDIIVGDSRTEEAMMWVYNELTGRDRVVFEYMTGWGGKPSISQTDIAGRLGVSPATITNIRKRIVDKIQRAEVVI